MELEAFNVQLFEAKARDPKVPTGKPFAKLSTLDLGLQEASKITCQPPTPPSLRISPALRPCIKFPNLASSGGQNDMFLSTQSTAQQEGVS
jgi:hypothetical protein